jgi:phosphoserine phosphatase
MSTIYLIRHGQTAWNTGKRFRGLHDIPLSDVGRLEAERAGVALREVKLARIYASPLSRAMETAELVRGEREVEIVSDAGFIDVDYGKWTQMQDDEVAEAYPELHRQWTNEPDRITFPKGENLEQVASRSLDRLRHLARVHADADIAIVSHRVPLKVILMSMKGMALSEFWNLPIDTGSVSSLGVDAGVLRLLCLNDTAHLHDLAGHESTDF